MLVKLENARSLLYYAAWAFDDGNAEAPVAAAMAHSYAREAAWDITSEAIQVHGGIGFTWEHDIHMFHRRALALYATDGTPADEREEIARAVLAC
jgi:alkylation response protein AidB-like acyl-CoA dehydrogenase